MAGSKSLGIARSITTFRDASLPTKLLYIAGVIIVLEAPVQVIIISNPFL